MRTANCSPISYPLLPSTHQHHMWDAWDMAAEICLSKLPQLIADPNMGFQPSPFFTDQLTAFEVWLDHGAEHKKPPEQLPIVLQVLLSQSHRFRALVLLGRFLDMGPWAVDLALSVGIFPYVLKLLQTTALELRQILVFIWTKILALDKSASQIHGGQFTAGFLDGSVRIYDVRTPELPVCSTRLHTQRVERVVGIGFQPGLDLMKIVSASQAGDIQFLDIRNPVEAYLTIDAHRGSLTALAVHRHAPIIASGSAKQIVKVFSLEGTQLSLIKYFPTFMGQKIGSVSNLTFHPYRLLLAAGAADACVSIYADDSYQSG